MNKSIKFFLFLVVFCFGFIAYEFVKLDKKLSKSSPFKDDIIINSIPAVTFEHTNSLDKYEAKSALGDILVVHFWATWCLPCVKELPEFINFSTSLKGLPVKFLIISVDDDKKLVEKFYLKNKISIPSSVISLFDINKRSKLFGSYKLPETFIFSREGRLLRKFSGPQKWQNESFSNFIKSL